jgi:hypothetical protein
MRIYLRAIKEELLDGLMSMKSFVFTAHIDLRRTMRLKVSAGFGAGGTGYCSK